MSAVTRTRLAISTGEVQHAANRLVQPPLTHLKTSHDSHLQPVGWSELHVANVCEPHTTVRV